jgi:hypothetical protein
MSWKNIWEPDLFSQFPLAACYHQIFGAASGLFLPANTPNGIPGKKAQKINPNSEVEPSGIR